jgi:polyisoprenyl-teichoic acid--peptidoglycan teichoic acid transferase
MNKKRNLVKLNKNLLKLLASHPKDLSIPRHDRRPKRSKKPYLIVSLVVFMICFTTFLGIASAVISRFALLDAFLTMMSTSSFIGDTNILVVGLDNVGGSHRTDTIMVLHISPKDRRVNVVSLPRDTIMNVPGIGLTKVNHAFAYGGINLTRITLENFFGVKIPFTVAINIDGLAKVIDTLGGLTINVEKRMYYVDYAGGLYVDLYPGIQHLNGRQALGYVRFRHDSSGDIGRILRQQRFMQALAAKIVTKKDVLSAPKVIMSLLSNINTNMSVRQILGLSLAMRQSFDIGNIDMTSIPGDSIMIDKVYYMKPNIAEVERITHQYLTSGILKKRTLVNTRDLHG